MKGFKGSGTRCEDGAEVGPPAVMSDESSTLSTTTSTSGTARCLEVIECPGCFRAVRHSGNETTSTSGTARCLEKAECPGCFRAVGHSRTNAPGCFRAVGTRGRGRAVLGRHFREASRHESDCHNHQPGRPVAWQSGFYLRSVHSCLRSRHTDLPVVLSIDGKETRVSVVDTCAQISFQPWQAEQVFLRCRHLPEEKRRQWTRAQDQALPRGER